MRLKVVQEKKSLDECLANYIRHISDLSEDVRVTNIPGFYNVRLDSWIFKSFLQI